MTAQEHVYILNDATGKRYKGYSSDMLKKPEMDQLIHACPF